jgi:hypothetical protein
MIPMAQYRHDEPKWPVRRRFGPSVQMRIVVGWQGVVTEITPWLRGSVLMRAVSRLLLSTGPESGCEFVKH